MVTSTHPSSQPPSASFVPLPPRVEIPHLPWPNCQNLTLDQVTRTTTTFITNGQVISVTDEDSATKRLTIADRFGSLDILVTGPGRLAASELLNTFVLLGPIDVVVIDGVVTGKIHALRPFHWPGTYLAFNSVGRPEGELKEYYFGNTSPSYTRYFSALPDYHCFGLRARFKYPHPIKTQSLQLRVWDIFQATIVINIAKEDEYHFVSSDIERFKGISLFTWLFEKKKIVIILTLICNYY